MTKIPIGTRTPSMTGTWTSISNKITNEIRIPALNRTLTRFSFPNLTRIPNMIRISIQIRNHALDQNCFKKPHSFKISSGREIQELSLTASIVRL
jgi:hypothetical protein